MLSYVLPLRHDRVDDEDVADLSAYVNQLVTFVDDVLVVDGSPGDVFAAYGTAFHPSVVHLPPDPAYSFANGKVDGVLTGVREARHERVVVADDDVRWDEGGLRRMAELLSSTDLVRPQNYFDPLPWYARWDTARMLINRAFGGDYPGTMGVRRSVLLELGGYDGDAMFENLELMRTVRAGGGTVWYAPDLFVRRSPPTFAQFRRQRVREAFDSFAQPVRLVLELALLPLAVLGVVRRGPAAVVAGLLASVGVAEVGRRRAHGRSVFPPSCAAFAPAWVIERAVCSWLALGHRVACGGCHYRGRVMRLAAHRERELRRRLGQGSSLALAPRAASPAADRPPVPVAGPGEDRVAQR